MILSAEAEALARPVSILVEDHHKASSYLISPYVLTVARAAKSSVKESVGEIIVWR